MSEIAGMSAKADSQRRRGRLLLRMGIAALATCAFAFVLGLILFLDHVADLEAPPELQAADGIVVLTGGQSRIDTGLHLLKAGKGKRLLISGVNPMARRDDLRLATGGDRNLFNCCIDIDRVALNTIGNAEESAKWASANTYGSIIVVTNNYHMPRSLLEMRRILPEADLQPYPVVNTPLSGSAWLANPDALRVLVIEYTKYVAALARGLVSTSHPEPILHDVHVEDMSTVVRK
ncbi:YdcF family protein [Chelativorans salis]|uniref:YdcF family protein n=1 Tax=Chelativorans salis TaxID=2978478 RepID=A0ABT2LS19_9HYPH|nr:YdcF family protein [Chelativorans sp. EGI FJ00035]MCT7377332.1 YdcF family protein [Chelativorans sp. EGI FJ00035]